MNILKKIKIVLLAAIFTASCTVIIYESPIQRARSTYIRHWQHYPYGSFWGNIYWQCQWYYRYPYYSRVLIKIKHHSPATKVVTKRQLQKPKSESVNVPKKKAPTKTVVRPKKETSEKTVKKKVKNAL